MRYCLVKNVIVWLGRFKGEIIIPFGKIGIGGTVL